MDSTGGEKASRFPEVMLLDSLNLVGSIAGLGHDVVLSSSLAGCGPGRFYPLLSHLISASLMLLSCFGSNNVVGVGSVLLCFCELSRREKKRMIVLRLPDKANLSVLLLVLESSTFERKELDLFLMCRTKSSILGYSKPDEINS